MKLRDQANYVLEYVKYAPHATYEFIGYVFDWECI